jgi:hypothetical protein
MEIERETEREKRDLLREAAYGGIERVLVRESIRLSDSP